MPTADEVTWMAPDPKMKELLAEMTRQPTPHLPKRWVLRYVPPKHLRLPGYDYGSVEDSELTEMRNLIRLNSDSRRKLIGSRRAISEHAQNEANDSPMANSRSRMSSGQSYGNLQELYSSVHWYTR